MTCEKHGTTLVLKGISSVNLNFKLHPQDKSFMAILKLDFVILKREIASLIAEQQCLDKCSKLHSLLKYVSFFLSIYLLLPC